MLYGWPAPLRWVGGRRLNYGRAATTPRKHARPSDASRKSFRRLFPSERPAVRASVRRRAPPTVVTSGAVFHSRAVTSVAAMYLPDELRALNSYTLRPSRTVRKVIFSVRLWTVETGTSTTSFTAVTTAFLTT